MRRIWEGLGIALFVSIVMKIWEKYGGINTIKSIYQTIIVELWPMWIGLSAALLYLIVVDYIKLRRFANYVKKWIGLFSYKDSYFDLKGKIYFYIKEELEKNKMLKK
jgi:hypothetical protein